MAFPTSLTRSGAAYPGMLGARRHRRRFLADYPEESEEADDRNGDGEKVDIFPIHTKRTRTAANGMSRLKSRI